MDLLSILEAKADQTILSIMHHWSVIDQDSTNIPLAASYYATYLKIYISYFFHFFLSKFQKLQDIFFFNFVKYKI